MFLFLNKTVTRALFKLHRALGCRWLTQRSFQSPGGRLGGLCSRSGSSGSPNKACLMKRLFSISFFDKLNVAAAKWKVRKIRGSNHLLHDGNLKVTKKQGRRSCNIYGEAKLRTAFTRRSLAFDQVGLVVLHCSGDLAHEVVLHHFDESDSCLSAFPW